MRPRLRTAAVFAALLLPAVAVACSWDYDTIRRERTRFPGTLELLTGKFLRHSPEFYGWRVADEIGRKKLLQMRVPLITVNSVLATRRTRPSFR